MLVHLVIVAIECAVIAAFLIAWYLVVKRKLRATFLREGGQLLSPFRYFSWILMALVVTTCMVQIHFLWNAFRLREEIGSLNKTFVQQQAGAAALADLKSEVERFRKTTESGFRELRSVNLSQRTHVPPPSGGAGDLALAQARSFDKEAQAGTGASRKDADKGGFAKEAKASSARAAKAEPVPAVRKSEDQEPKDTHSMRLSRVGNVISETLRVRRQPLPDAPVIESLSGGQKVKVTEKRLIKDTVWFRIVTPSGKAGWVDFRHLKLDNNPDGSVS
jgi:hypothetical protein